MNDKQIAERLRRRYEKKYQKWIDSRGTSNEEAAMIEAQIAWNDLTSHIIITKPATNERKQNLNENAEG